MATHRLHTIKAKPCREPQPILLAYISAHAVLQHQLQRQMYFLRPDRNCLPHTKQLRLPHGCGFTHRPTLY